MKQRSKKKKGKKHDIFQSKITEEHQRVKVKFFVWIITLRELFVKIICMIITIN